MPLRPDHRAPLTPRAIARLAPLPRSFYVRDPLTVARELLGKLLIRLVPEDVSAPVARTRVLAGRIVESEAYLGADDPGAHAYRGLTPRNAVLFGPPGHAYVYFIYGNHYCTNVSCQPAGVPGGVLLRALEPVCGIPAMAALRGLTLPPRTSDAKMGQTELSQAALSQAQLRRLTSGPGRLSAALGITRPLHNGCDLCSRSSGLYIASDPDSAVAEISTTPRINVTRAPHDEWRFVLTGNPFVSGKRFG
ncbi:MAG: DNA-3-methyladenine glycosylase [Candidatus Korobacteraceae bacterium]